VKFSPIAFILGMVSTVVALTILGIFQVHCEKDLVNHIDRCRLVVVAP